jgi:rare lipoprotein A
MPLPFTSSDRKWLPSLRATRPSVVLLAAAALAACASAPLPLEKDGPPSGSVAIPDLPAAPVPRPEPRSRYGNTPEYEVLGKRYRVLPSASGYSERGVASWYGKKFHGRLTSNRETYNMYAMSAAHKTLPLPTYVRVRNLSNGRSVIVRVNDRGPFADDRIIDLSYAAAMRLDMLESGTGFVEVTAISFDEPAGDRPTSRTSVDFAAPDRASDVFLQVGAFGARDNAERLLGRLSSAGIANAFIHAEPGKPLFRVRIGPLDDVGEFDRLTALLERNGVADAYLVDR